MLTELKIGAAVVGVLLTLSSCGVANHYRHDRDKWRNEAHDLRVSRDAWAKGYKDVVKQLMQEREAAQTAQAQARKDCDAEVSSARASQKALNRTLAKPIKLDARQCPIRQSISTSELAAILTPGGR